MFDALSERLQSTLDGVRQRGTLTEADIDYVIEQSVGAFRAMMSEAA